MKKELHFYTDISDERQTPEDDLDTMLVDWVNTDRAISTMINTPFAEEIIRTTQLSFLRNAWYYVDYGVDVYIHLREDVLKVEEGMKGTAKDIRRGCNLLTLLLGGAFGEIYNNMSNSI